MCASQANAQYRANSPEKARQSCTRWRINNKERTKQTSAEWLSNNRERKNKTTAAWRANNPNRTKDIEKRKYDKRMSTPHGKLNTALRTSLRKSLKRIKNGRSWETLVGYTVSDLKKHLESQFEEGMSWDNYGRNGWHIDHKTPLSWFNFSAPEDRGFKKCWALENLQPMWAIENIKKGNHYMGEYKGENHGKYSATL